MKMLPASSSLSLLLIIGISAHMASARTRIAAPKSALNGLTKKSPQQTMLRAMRGLASDDECSEQQQAIDDSGANDLDTPESDGLPDFCRGSEDGEDVIICDYEKIGATLDADKCNSLGGSIVTISLTLQCDFLFMGLNNAPACLSDACDKDQVAEEYAVLWNDDEETCDIDVNISEGSYLNLNVGFLSKIIIMISIAFM